MPGGYHEHPGLFAYLPQLDPGGGHRRAEQRHVAAAVEEAAGRLGEVEGGQPHVDPRVGTLERGQQQAPGVPACYEADPDRQGAGRDPRRVARRRDAPVEGGQGFPGRGEEGLPRRGEGHAAAAALEQPGAHRVFQLPDLGTQYLLGDVDLVRRGGEALLLRHRDEVSQVPQLDVHRPLIL